MKKELKIVAVVLVALIVFLCGFGLGAKKGITIDVKVEGGAAQAVATTPAPAPTAAPDTTAAPAPTAAPDTTAAPAGSDTTAAPAGSDATTAAPAGNTGMPSSKEEIVAKYVELYNAAKNEQNVKIHKVGKVDIQVTDFSVPSLSGAINKIVEGLVKPYDENWEIVNGAASDGSGTTANNVLTPGGREITLKPEGVANATCTPEGDGYKMVITLIQEKSTFDGTNTVNPVHHESCLQPLNLATLEIKPATISAADMTYPGATITMVVNGAGKPTHVEQKLPMEGSGSGKLGLSVTVGLKGEMNETFDLTY